MNAAENSEESEKLELLSILVENYENKHHSIDIPDPIEAIKFRMDQMGIRKKDLEPSIGSRGRISEILNKKRNLTLPMIRKLNRLLNNSCRDFDSRSKEKSLDSSIIVKLILRSSRAR